jgi:hypothetical protein
MAPDEVGRGEVLVARDRDQRPAELVRHRLDETGLAATRRALEHHGEALGEGSREQQLLVADGQIERCLTHA